VNYLAVSESDQLQCACAVGNSEARFLHQSFILPQSWAISFLSSILHFIPKFSHFIFFVNRSFRPKVGRFRFFRRSLILFQSSAILCSLSIFRLFEFEAQERIRRRATAFLISQIGQSIGNEAIGRARQPCGPSCSIPLHEFQEEKYMTCNSFALSRRPGLNGPPTLKEEGNCNKIFMAMHVEKWFKWRWKRGLACSQGLI
jgi:hypothetical protein